MNSHFSLREAPRRGNDAASARGFTLIELVVVIGIMIAIGGVVVVNLAGRKSKTDLTDATKQIAALVRQAQSDSMSQEGGVKWGIVFSNASSATYSLISKPLLAIGTTTVAVYPLPPSVACSGRSRRICRPTRPSP